MKRTCYNCEYSTLYPVRPRDYCEFNRGNIDNPILICKDWSPDKDTKLLIALEHNIILHQKVKELEMVVSATKSYVKARKELLESSGLSGYASKDYEEQMLQTQEHFRLWKAVTDAYENLLSMLDEGRSEAYHGKQDRSHRCSSIT